MMQKAIWTHYVWEVGTPDVVAAELVKLGADTVIVKVSNGRYQYAESVYRKLRGENTQSYVDAFRRAGLKVIGFHWGEPSCSVQQEIDAINQAIDDKGLSTFILNLEGNYSELYDRTERLIRGLRTGIDYGLSSGRYPDVYPSKLHWSALLEFCIFTAPQIYWYGQHNADVQISKSIQAYEAKYKEYGLSPDPWYPILPTHKWRDWLATPEDMNAAVQAAGDYAKGYSFFVLRHLLHPDLSKLKQWVTNFQYESKPKTHVHDLSVEAFRDLVTKSLQEPAKRFVDAEGFVI